jgi:hypothetical protein
MCRRAAGGAAPSWHGSRANEGVVKIDGRCHCGLVTYVTEVAPETATICHCTDCQTLSGTAFRTSVVAERANFRLMSGELRTYVKVGDSGRRRAQTFCPICGSPIYSTSADDPTSGYNIRIGTIRQRNQLIPRAQIWCRSAQPWVTDLRDVPGEETESL